MPYEDEREYSAEILRLAIPQMARYGSSMNPLNYAVWYTHVAGSNPALSSEVSQLLQQGSPLTSDQVRDLFDGHVNEYDVDTIRRVRSDLKGVMDEVVRSTSESHAQTTAFEATLQGHVARLEQPTAPAEMERLLQSVLGEAQNMRAGVGSLKAQLDNAVTEVTRLHAELEKVREETLRDALTGIANRRGFEQTLEQALMPDDRGVQRRCCLLLIDIDHFKRINDTYGHVLGDRVIASVGKVLERAAAPGQTPARYGGEEFAVVMPGATRDQACRLAELIRANVEKGRVRRRDSQSSIGRVTVSLGVGIHAPCQTASELIEMADKALYTSKEKGRNRVTILPDRA